MLGPEMEKNQVQVKHASGDADFDIAMFACEAARMKHVVVLGDDTDVLVLLLHHYKPGLYETIHFQTNTNLINIPILQKSLEPASGSSMFFIHALSGCDTTSRPYCVGKSSAMRKYQGLKEFAEVFMKTEQKQEEIEEAGNKALATLYGGTANLNLERAAKFTEKVVSRSAYLPPERLPPTSKGRGMGLVCAYNPT